jgi:hypothetical protein
VLAENTTSNSNEGLAVLEVANEMADKLKEKLPVSKGKVSKEQAVAEEIVDDFLLGHARISVRLQFISNPEGQARAASVLGRDLHLEGYVQLADALEKTAFSVPAIPARCHPKCLQWAKASADAPAASADRKGLSWKERREMREKRLRFLCQLFDFPDRWGTFQNSELAVLSHWCLAGPQSSSCCAAHSHSSWGRPVGGSEAVLAAAGARLF